jgi:ATP-dependent RNA helicase DeaD
VEPRQIVGALANEGGLGRDDFGAIAIKPEFSIVELPVNMDPSVLDKLRDTRISGRLIEIKPDRGVPNRRSPRDRDDHGGRDDRGHSHGGHDRGHSRDDRGRSRDDRGSRGDRSPSRDDRSYSRDDRSRRDDRDSSRDDRPARKPRHKN